MKLQIIYLAVCSLTTQAVYISRMATVQRTRSPVAFRPGVNLQQRPWSPARFVQATSHRAPYVLYRNAPHRYMTKPYTQGTRSVYNMGSGPWKTTSRLPFSASTPEYEFVRSASAQHPLQLQPNGGKGAIHTIPAPNLSLSEKPIVVLESSDGQQTSTNHVASDATKQAYEVTEKYVDPTYYHSLLGTKTIEAAPVGFSKQGQISSQDLNALMRNSAALQMAADYGLQAITLPQAPLVQSQPQQPITLQLQSFPVSHSPPELTRQGLEGIIIPPNALYQHDPTLLQKIQNTLLQRFPSIEFVPYNPDLQPQVSTPIYVLNNNDVSTLSNQQQLSVIPISHNENHKTVVRETQESNVVTILPQVVTPSNNVSENEVIPTTQTQNITLELVATETQTQPQTTTVKYVIETSTEDQKLAPIYYAQVGQSVGNVIANGFYSAINDVRAAAALDQVDKFKVEEIKKVDNGTTTTTTVNPDVKQFFVQSLEKNENNETINDLKPLLGVPFTKPDSGNVAYTLHRNNEKDKVVNDGKVLAGQIVEATITEDHDFNKEKADLLTRRAPLRLVSEPEIKEPNKQINVHNNQIETQSKHVNVVSTASIPKYSVVKAKIPPKSKLTFDDKTGEPILRIYASYVNSPAQKDLIANKLHNMKHTVGKKEGVSMDSWKVGTVRALSKDHSSTDMNKVTQFGLKLKSRMDDIAPIFDEYERKR